MHLCTENPCPIQDIERLKFLENGYKTTGDSKISCINYLNNPMPTNPHYEAVRAKVIATCPELMELSKDCLVKYSKKGSLYPYKRRETDYYCGQCQEGMFSGQAFSSYRCGYCRKGFSHPNTGTPRYCKECARKHLVCQYCACYFLIVGNPIRLSHIIRTIEMSDRYEYNKDFEIREVVFGGASYENREDLRGPHWNLKEDSLELQSLEVWEALDKMLSV